MRHVLLLVLLALVGCSSTYRPLRLARLPDVPATLHDSVRVNQRSAEGAVRPVALRTPEAVPASVPRPMVLGDEQVTLKEVLRSLEAHFPALIAARLEIAAAEARLLAAEGAFDTRVGLGAKAKVSGYYEHEILDLNVEQPIEELGATVIGGYRFGLGEFGSYDGDIWTNHGGEFFLGVDVPLLKGAAIDSRRAKLWKARIDRDATDPMVHEKRVSLTRKATQAYWKCIAAARKLEVADALLQLAITRRQSLADAVELGQLAAITTTDNERLVVERRGILAAARREFDRAVLALSLYHRDAKGTPIRLVLEDLPEFPELPELTLDDLDTHVRFGLRHRPETRLMALELARKDIEREKRENDLLPKLSLQATASQDIGASNASGSDDPFEFGVGIKFDMPLARRAARGRLDAIERSISQLAQKVRLLNDQVELEIRDAASALTRARERLVLSLRAVELAETMEAAERDRLFEGESDLLQVNLREQSTAKARSEVISARLACFAAVADYRAAVGLPRVPGEE